MASRKKQAEGIALLSMYNDEDDEEMDDLDDHHHRPHEENNFRESNDMVSDEFANEEATPPVLNQNSTPNDGLLRPLTPQLQSQVSSSSSPQQQQQQQRVVNMETKGSKRGRLAIVDYAHDEVAMSPEPEEGEFNEEFETANGAIGEKTPPGNAQSLNHSIQATLQSSEHFEHSQPDEMNSAINESEAVEPEDTIKAAEENGDPLDKFLPPPPEDKCPEELQRKIDKFLALKKIGRSFNAEVRNRKDYRNPDFLLHAVRYQDIDQIGSCINKDVFDPHGYDQSDYYLEIEADMRRGRERKEQELKKSPRVEFLSGGTQPGVVVPPSKFSMPIPVVATSGMNSASTTADAVPRDGRQNKKSKWDKVDGDGRNPLPSGGQDSLVAAHAALLSAANVGAGYTAFVQQKRREAEEKRSSERKLERRS